MPHRGMGRVWALSATQDVDGRAKPGHDARVRAWCLGYLPSSTVTKPTWLLRLLAVTGFPSGVTSMLRTMSPPPGIAQVWNFSVLGSNRTIVFGLANDSLYQSAPLVKTMPYGSDFGPLGEGNSLTLPVLGSSRPRKPRAKSVYQMMSWSSIAMRRGRAAGSGSGNSLICMLSSMVATFGAPNSTKNTCPFESTAMP